MGILKDRVLIILILSGLFIRLALANLPGFKVDITDWFGWAIRLNQVGYTNFYSKEVFSDYTPGFLYVLSLLGFLKNILAFDDKIFLFFLKFPAILAEIVLSIFIYKQVAKKASIFYGRLATTFILFNPAFIFNSAIWGQIDGILSLFLCLSIYYLVVKKLAFSSILFAVAFLIKPQALAILPIYFLYLLKNFTIKNFIQLILPSTFVIFILSLPFFQNPISGLINLLKNSANVYPYTSLFSYNLWGVVGFWVSDNVKFSGFSYKSIGICLYITYWIIISYFYLKKRFSLYSFATLVILGFYFLPTRIHERYLYPVIPFLILTAAIWKSRLLLILTLILNLIHFLNLYYVYVYYNEIYFNLPKLLYNPTVYSFLDTQGKSISLISTGVFILLVYVIIKLEYEFKKS